MSQNYIKSKNLLKMFVDSLLDLTELERETMYNALAFEINTCSDVYRVARKTSAR